MIHVLISTMKETIHISSHDGAIDGESLCNDKVMFVSGDKPCTKRLGRIYMKILASDRFISIKTELVLCILRPVTLLEWR